MSEELFAAIEGHNTEQLAALLDAGADPCAFRAKGKRWTALCSAIDQLDDGGSVDAVVLLLRYGAAVNEWDEEHEATALLMSVWRNRPEVMHILLAAGADVNVVGVEGDSPLRYCVERGRYEDVATLLRCGAKKTIDEAGGLMAMTALGHAAHRLDLPMIVLLLSAGADPKALDIDDDTARQHLLPRSSVDSKMWDLAAALLDDGRA